MPESDARSLEEGAGKRCSECGVTLQPREFLFLLPSFKKDSNLPSAPRGHLSTNHSQTSPTTVQRSREERVTTPVIRNAADLHRICTKFNALFGITQSAVATFAAAEIIICRQGRRK